MNDCGMPNRMNSIASIIHSDASDTAMHSSSPVDNMITLGYYDMYIQVQYLLTFMVITPREIAWPLRVPMKGLIKLCLAIKREDEQGGSKTYTRAYP